ncbi:MAG: ribosome maturation factor RimM [Oscillospiraceae bacterium]|nr:ribosome maturation factor RimM [Oscillospiraceae bacterium]
MHEYLEIGKILKPQGLLGEMKVQPATDDPRRFAALDFVYIKRGEVYKPIRVIEADVRGGLVFIRLEGIGDRAAAEKLRGEWLHIDRGHAVKGDPDGVFIADMIGCAVEDERGNPVGTLRDVLQPGANDVYEIETPRGLLWVPALKSVVMDIDIDARLITVSAARLPECAVWEREPLPPPSI